MIEDRGSCTENSDDEHPPNVAEILHAIFWSQYVNERIRAKEGESERERETEKERESEKDQKKQARYTQSKKSQN